MNKQEREFYEYLVRLPDVTFDNWLDNASDEELDLADRLFDEVKFGQLDKIDDVSDAQNFLRKFTLKG